MTAKNQLLTAPPYQVEMGLKTLGQNLRLARRRRRLTLEEVATKLGTTRQAVAAAERGKPSSTIAIYAGLLWVYGMTRQLTALADPGADEEGLIMDQTRHRYRAKSGSRELDSDF